MSSYFRDTTLAGRSGDCETRQEAPQNGRVAGEFGVFRVVATVTTAIKEDDGDIHHLVFTGDGSILIGDALERAWSGGARDRRAINKARIAVLDV